LNSKKRFNNLKSNLQEVFMKHKKLLCMVLAVVMFMVFVGITFAASPEDEAKGLVLKAYDFYKKNGKDAFMNEIKNPKGQFAKGELYVFLWSWTPYYTCIAHPYNHKLHMMNMNELRDPDGKTFVKDGVELAKAKGEAWFEYKYTNPVTKKIELKKVFVKKADDFVIVAGVYKK